MGDFIASKGSPFQNLLVKQENVITFQGNKGTDTPSSWEGLVVEDSHKKANIIVTPLLLVVYL